jgi:hypothetical protein
MVETHRDCINVTILENLIKNVKTSDIFNEKDGELDMMLISCNILIVLTCKFTLINGHQSFKLYLHLQLQFMRLN